MNFNTIIKILEKIYRFTEKFNLEFNFDVDSFLDNNYPEISSELIKYIENKRIIFSSTNGKKTSLHLLNEILKANNSDFVTNLTKSAKTEQILSSIIKKFDFLTENQNANNFLTTTSSDEELIKNFNLLNFDYLVLGNLFTSQVEFSNLYEKKKKIQDAIILNSKLDLVINADEPMFFEIDEIKNDTIIGKKRNKFYFGIDNLEIFDNRNNLIHKTDIIKCPKCGCNLQYKKRYYSHLGDYFCECGFRRPKLNMSANVRVFSDYSFAEVLYNDKKMVFKLPIGGMYNVYNALSAIAVATLLKIDRKTISLAFENYENLKARDEILTYKGKKIKIKTIKNSTSLSEAVLEANNTTNKKLVFVFDSNFVDGIDTSWIWEANLNSLNNFENRIYVTGKRFDDMALRLKYAGVNPSLISMDNQIKNSINSCYWALEKNEEMLILSVPSMIDEVYKFLK